MKKGGYKILDFKGISFASGTAKTKAQHKLSIYEQIEATNKVILVSGVVFNNVELDDFFIEFWTGSNSTFTGRVLLGPSVLTISVTDADTITMTSAS